MSTKRVTQVGSDDFPRLPIVLRALKRHYLVFQNK